MTLQAMKEHEAVTLHYAKTDYRRRGAVKLALDYAAAKDVLDLRCLEGEVIVALAAQGAGVKGLDGYPGAVELTNAFAEQSGIPGPIAYLWNLKQLPPELERETYDCIVCLDVLNHVEDDKKTLKLIHNALRPGGRLVLLVPAFPSLLGKRDRSLGHLRRYTKRGLAELLEQLSFSVQRLRFWNALALPGYVLIEKVLKRRLSDTVRYRGAGSLDLLTGPVLRFWFEEVERRVAFPFGLSLFAVCTKD